MSGERAFSHAGPAAWYLLPETVHQERRQSEFYETFKNIFRVFMIVTKGCKCLLFPVLLVDTKPQ